MVFGVEMIILNSKNILDGNQEGIEELFEYFRRDFIENDTFLIKNEQSFFINVRKNIICPCPYTSMEDKPERFWHIISQESHKIKNSRIKKTPCKKENRKYDVARAKRIHWIKIIIDNWVEDEDIKSYYQKDSKRNRYNLLIWHRNRDFVVIIRKESNSSDRFLISSFIIHGDKKRKYKKEYEKYMENAPLGVEWF